jgi:hypothetical protein
MPGDAPRPRWTARAGLRASCASIGLVASLLVARGAAAGGLDFDLVGARSIGRAGTTMVSGDSGTALVVNPAGLARTSSLRLQLGIAVHDDDSSYRAPDPDDPEAPAPPIIVDRSSPAIAPSAAVHGAIGSFVLGLTVLELGHLDRRLPDPAPGQPPGEVDRFFPHRYGGLELGYRRRVAVLGAATRIGDWLGLGVSVGGSDVEMGERRRVWAGFAGRDPLGGAARDLELTLVGRDRLVPFAAAGVLVAPPSLPLELAASLSWSDDASLDGDHTLSRTSIERFPEPVAVSERTTELRLAMPTTLRGGLRYLGDRFLVEVGGDLTWFRSGGDVPSWRVGGIEVRDETGAAMLLDDVPSLAAQCDHGAVRGAVDVEVVSGLLWLTAGYAYSSGGTGRSHVSPGFGDLAGHTVSLGAEGTWNQITFILGLARRMSPAITLSAEKSDVMIENPFDAGTASAAAGRHERAHDTVGLTIDLAWE